MSLKLNSVSNDAFEVNGADTKMGRISRNDLIATGRAIALEYNGRLSNQIRNNKDYSHKMEDIRYSNLSAKHKEKLLMFCAAQA